MGDVRLRSTFVNRGTETLPARLDELSHAAIDELLRAYNPIAGPIRKVVTYFCSTGAMPIHVGHCEYYDLDYVLQRLTGISSLDTGVSRSVFSGGKGYDLPTMFLSTLGETVERVLSTLPSFGSIPDRIFGTYRDLTRDGLRCLSPEELPLFAERQYADPEFLFERYTEDSHMGWTAGKRLSSGEEVLVPAQLVELVYTRSEDEAMIGYSVSGGLTSHTSTELAVFHGITELIERDAVNLHWYCRIPPKRIVLDREFRRPELARLWDVASSLPGSIAFHHHCIDFHEVPVITAIEIDPWLTRRSYYSGGGADVDIDTALLKALNEFGQAERTMRLSLVSPERSFAQLYERLFEMQPDDPVRMIDVFFKVVSYYGYRENVAKLDWYRNGEEVLLSSLPEMPPTDPRARLDHLLRACARHGVDPIVFDRTPEQMDHVKLIKVFIPELTQPFLQSLPCLGHPRFREAARLSGVDDRLLEYEDLLQDPLPYP